MVIEKEVTLAEIDEAISHVNAMLKIDVYGNRMNWKKRQTLQQSIDDLLDARLNLVKTGSAVVGEDETGFDTTSAREIASGATATPLDNGPMPDMQCVCGNDCCSQEL